MPFQFSFQLFEHHESLSDYSIIKIDPPEKANYVFNDFTSGEFYRTTRESSTGNLVLDLDDRIISLLVDMSGSMSWNDNVGDRFTYLTRLLNKLKYTYPSSVSVNLLTFGGSLIQTDIVSYQATSDLQQSFLDSRLETDIQQSSDFDSQFNFALQSQYKSSTYSFAGIRIIRRNDRFPTHPADGVVVGEGIITSIEDVDLIDGQRYYYGIWSYNEQLHFSSGRFISAVAQKRILPLGLDYFSSTTRILSGITRDSNTKLIYNFIEKTGKVVFDSSGENNHGLISDQVVESNFWSGEGVSYSFDSSNNPIHFVGVRFDGQFDIIEASGTEDLNIIGSDFINSHGLTINIWLYRYAATGQQWVIGTTTDSITNNVGWAFGLDESGLLTYAFLEDISFGLNSSSVFIPEKQWTMVTLVLGSDGDVSVYKNGTLEETFVFTNGSSDASTVSYNKLHIGGKLESSSASWIGSDYYGSLAFLSISNTERSSSYIAALYTREGTAFNQTQQYWSETPPDNTQREVLLNWFVGSNLTEDSIKILRKYNSPPEHSEDGEEVLAENLGSGSFFYIDSYDFINGENYYYRAFTLNDTGNTCSIEDARLSSAHIPYTLTPSDLSFSTVSSVSDAEAVVGNQKVWLKWSNPISDSNWKGTKIFYSAKGYPQITRKSDGTLNLADSYELFDTTSSFFIHRSYGISSSGTEIPLNNYQYHFYTILSYDRLGNFSLPINIMAIPDPSIEAEFPPEDVLHLTIENLNNNTLSIKWNNPIVKSQTLNLYMNDAAIVMVRIKDIYGESIDNSNDMKLLFCATVTKRSISTSEQPLGITSFRTDTKSILPLNSTDSSFKNPLKPGCNGDIALAEIFLDSSSLDDGNLRGILSHVADPLILARREEYIIDVAGIYSIQDPSTTDSSNIFEYTTEAIRIIFTNPLQISMVNFLKKFVFIPGSKLESGQIRGNHPCKCSDDTDQATSEGQSFNGSYILANQPYVCRIEITYKNTKIPDGTPVIIRLYEHDDGALQFSRKSSRVSIREGTYLTSTSVEDDIDFDGNKTGIVVVKSYVDVPVPSPSLPDWVDIYAQVQYQGIMADAVHSIRFISNISLTIDANKPEPNGIDIAEQFASVTMTDPNDTTSIIPVPDGTLVKWELIPMENGRSRPFFSTEQLSQKISGVYSSVYSGIARNVFFGPLSGLEPHNQQNKCSPPESCCVAEDYVIKASVILNEVSDFDQEMLAYDCNPQSSDFANKRFLMNIVPDQTNDFGPGPEHFTWGDGINFLKFVIAKNPSISEIDQAQCFRDCVERTVGGQLFSFNNGQIVTVKAPGDIIYNATVSVDEYTGEETLIDYDIQEKDNATGYSTAKIPIQDEETYFYVRNNIFTNSTPARQECDPDTESDCMWNNVCSDSSCTYIDGYKWNEVSPVSGQASIIVNNQSVTLYGGGDYQSGIPPIMLGWKEPLSCKVVNARVGSETVTELKADGNTINTFVVEVKFDGVVVPDGTPVDLVVTGDSLQLINLSSSRIYTTQTTTDPILCQNGENRSLAYFSIDPIPNVAFSAKITATCQYDKLKTVTRQISDCIELSNMVVLSPNQNPEQTPDVIPTGEDRNDELAQVVSKELLVFNTATQVFSLKTGMSSSRIGHFIGKSEHNSGENIYVFGGYNGSSLNQTSEAYSFSSNSWRSTTDIPTPRSFGMSATIGNKTYCIGGMELDPISSNYTVSRKVEIFNSFSESWEFGSDMPENFGVIFGTSEVCGSFIYVLCGALELLDNCRPGKLNTSILKYDTSQDVWSIINVTNTSLYQRVSPVSFSRDGGQNIYVLNGSFPKSETQIQSEITEQTTKLLLEFEAQTLISSYYLSLTPENQKTYVDTKKQEIKDSVIIAPYVYLMTGYIINTASEVDEVISMSDILDDDWMAIPEPKDRSKAVYFADQDAVYIIGGSNQNQSTTLNLVETIAFSGNDVFYEKLVSLSRGRTWIETVAFGSEIFIVGGMTSGHKSGYLNLSVSASPEQILATGNQSSGIIIQLQNDAGELIQTDVRVSVRGRIRIPEIDSALIKYLAFRIADKAGGGDGTGISSSTLTSFNYDLYNKIRDNLTNPNSDIFQFNSATNLQEQLLLFPILYTNTDFTVKSGIASTVLLARSEDPFTDLKNLADFINLAASSIPPSEQKLFNGQFTRDELVALGNVLAGIANPTISLFSNAYRELYQVETVVTVLDSFYYGQTVSDFDNQLYLAALDAAQQLATPTNTNEAPDNGPIVSGSEIKKSSCYVLQHLEEAQANGGSGGSGSGGGGPGGSPNPSGNASTTGQSLSSKCLIALNPSVITQNSSITNVFFNNTDWLPQTREYLFTNNSSIDEALSVLDKLAYQTPFGSSQLYDGLFDIAQSSTSEDLENIKKSIYIVSDGFENLSRYAIYNIVDDINAINGEFEVPVIYTNFDTSFPLSLASQLGRAENSNIVYLTQNTGGQSTSLLNSKFMDFILNLTINGATGGFGYGTYVKTIDFTEIMAITSVDLIFELPSNTYGSLKFRSSDNSFVWSSWSDNYAGTGLFLFSTVFARYVEIEVTLTTGFSSDIDEYHDTDTTGVPKFVSVTFSISAEKEDFIFVKPEILDYNIQQLAAAVDSTIPSAANIEIGVATSNSCLWQDYASDDRPSINEEGTTFLIDRVFKDNSNVRNEKLKPINNRIYKAEYGVWDSFSVVSIYYDTKDGLIQKESGFYLVPQSGEVVFDTNQISSVQYYIQIINQSTGKVGIRFSNRNHDSDIEFGGIGFSYTTNNTRLPPIAQASPKATSLFLLPNNPTTSDTYVASYKYIDINGDLEEGSTITWFINGEQYIELNNKLSWNYLDLRFGHIVDAGDSIVFSVIPNDGLNLGPISYSNPTTILSSPPVISNLRVDPYRNNVLQDRFESGSTLIINYEFVTFDKGSTESESIITWFSNGVQYYQTTFSSGDTNLKKRLTPISQQDQGYSSMTLPPIGTKMYVEVTPKTPKTTGTTVRSNEFTINNTIPIVSNVSITPSSPTAAATLAVSYSIDDIDITRGTNSGDLSELRWFVSTDGTTFSVISALNNSKTVSSSFLRVNQYWYVEVTAYDGFDLGNKETSKIVVIQA